MDVRHRYLLAAAAATTFGIGTATNDSPAAVILDVRSNQVADGSINTTAGNNNRSDWTGVIGYTPDTNETSTVDWAQVFVAHDSANVYLRYLMNSSASGFLTFNQRAFIDTDQSRGTGFTGGGDQLGIGAEFMLEGATLYAFTGGSNQTAFSWSSVQGLSFDDFPTNDQEMTIPRASLGGPDAFDFVLFASGSPEDYYPNTGNAGALLGGAFRYIIVPEPSALSLLALGSIALMRRRRPR